MDRTDGPRRPPCLVSVPAYGLLYLASWFLGFVVAVVLFGLALNAIIFFLGEGDRRLAWPALVLLAALLALGVGGANALCGRLIAARCPRCGGPADNVTGHPITFRCRSCGLDYMF